MEGLKDFLNEESNDQILIMKSRKINYENLPFILKDHIITLKDSISKIVLTGNSYSFNFFKAFSEIVSGLSNLEVSFIKFSRLT